MQILDETCRQLRARGWQAIVFDIDGTLFSHSSANSAVFSKLSNVETMLELDRQYSEGLIGNDTVADRLALTFKNHTIQEVTAGLASSLFIKDYREVCEALQRNGIHVLIATVTWRFVAEWVAQQLDAEAICGVELAMRDGLFTGHVQTHVHAQDKTRALTAWCAQHDSQLANCIAVGDSRSDLDLFEHVGLAVALNGSADAKQAAALTIDTQSLLEVLELINDVQH